MKDLFDLKGKVAVVAGSIQRPGGGCGKSLCGIRRAKWLCLQEEKKGWTSWRRKLRQRAEPLLPPPVM